jgi:hypothetical protein
MEMKKGECRILMGFSQVYMSHVFGNVIDMWVVGDVP